MPAPAWLLRVLRAFGIRRAADVVPVATRAAEAIAEAIDDTKAEPITRKVPHAVPCDKPPPGWICTRERGHDGACAAWPAPPGGTLIIKAAPPRPPRKGK